MTPKPHSEYEPMAIRSYLIYDKSSIEPYVFNDVKDAALCAARCNALGHLEKVRLGLNKDGSGICFGVSFDDILNAWENDMSAYDDSLSDYRKSSNQDLPEYFSKLGFYFNI